jgi:hypothetical protein
VIDRKAALNAVVLAGALAIAFTLSAQWPDYPHSNVPRTKEGKAILDGPTPRTPDGKVDFSGIWAFGGGGGLGKQKGKDFKGDLKDKGDKLGKAGKGKQAKGYDPSLGYIRPPADQPPLANFKNIGTAFPNGLPLKPEARTMLEARIDQNSKDNPDAHCLPLGLMQLHTHPQPRKIIQTPNLMVMLFEAQAGIRQIFMDGRPVAPKDVLPWWYAYSVGHWEGDTLVVESTGFRDDVWLDIDGSPLTNTGKMTERFRRPNYGTLEIDITFEDPAVYTEPFTTRVVQRIMPDTDLIEFICQENDTSGPHLVGK